MGVEGAAQLDPVEVEDDAVLPAELGQAGLAGPGLLGAHPVLASNGLLHGELPAGGRPGVELVGAVGDPQLVSVLEPGPRRS